MKYSVSVISLGCSKNLIDSELMMGILDKNGYKLIHDPESANIIIINTCGFIDSAKEESINAIIEAGQYKTNGKCKLIIVAGCLGERYKNELLDELPEVDGIVGTGNIRDIVEVINELLKGNKLLRVGKIDEEYHEDIPRISSTPSYTSYVKIAEGCDNFCTYCIIPKLRGKYRSRKKESIVKEVKDLAINGTKEIILIAQDTTKYGIDIYGDYMLPELLNELNNIEGIKWIRVLYLYPDTFTKELIKSFKDNDKVVKYVDIPIQHINDSVLKRMNRKTSKKLISALIMDLRREIPDIIIRTTLIVGFPGESTKEFEELYDYVEKMQFDKLGVFTYSQEEGTPANDLKDQIDEETKVARQRLIMDLQQRISQNKSKEKIGKKYEVIIEELIAENEYVGRTYMDSPEIDGIVYIKCNNRLEVGSLVDVKIIDSLEYDLIGEI